MPQGTPFSTWFWQQFMNQFTGQPTTGTPTGGGGGGGQNVQQFSDPGMPYESPGFTADPRGSAGITDPVMRNALINNPGMPGPTFDVNSPIWPNPYDPNMGGNIIDPYTGGERLNIPGVFSPDVYPFNPGNPSILGGGGTAPWLQPTYIPTPMITVPGATTNDPIYAPFSPFGDQPPPTGLLPGESDITGRVDNISATAQDAVSPTLGSGTTDPNAGLPLPGSNPSGYQPLPPDIFQQIYGQFAPTSGTPAEGQQLPTADTAPGDTATVEPSPLPGASDPTAGTFDPNVPVLPAQPWTDATGVPYGTTSPFGPVTGQPPSVTAPSYGTGPFGPMPGQPMPSFWSQLNQPTNWPNFTRQISNIAGDVGNVLGTAATDVGNFFGGIAGSIMDPSQGYYSPDYLSSLGYTAATPDSAFFPPQSGLPVGDPTAPGGPSAGAIALGLGPLPGATVGGSMSPTNFGSAALQNAIFHGIWGGKAPMDYNTWQAGAGTPQGWAAQVGGNYQNYIDIWNRLRNQGATFGGQATAGQRGSNVGAGSGSVPGGAGRGPTSPR